LFDPRRDRNLLLAEVRDYTISGPRLKIIELEYIIGLSLFLKLFSMFNCVFVTPGPFSIYRKSLLKKIGGFDPENITEDLEIAYRIHKSKYKIANCMGAKVRTIIPQTFKEIYVQRRRWYSGAIQTLFKHRNMALNKNFDLFGYFIPYNYLLIFLGLSLFLTSTYLGISNFIENLLYFQYTNFNFLERIFDFEFDILRTGMIYLIGCSSLFIGMFVMISGLKFTNKEISRKKLGVVGYPLLFILYQIFWIGSILTVMRGKKIKWK
jgi:cellulose synthase/poly-beta-1,6-N-acetylglucosamine synthase-like glycosyltransferase